MTSTEIVVAAPPETNLKDLASSTVLVFNLLRPWYKSEYSSIALRSIKLQAQAYMKALGFSIEAAQIGFNIAEEAIAFAKHIDLGTEEDRQGYLRGMHEIALHGQDNAERAHQSFKNVRKDVGQLIENAKTQQGEEKSNVALTSPKLEELESGISTLEKFSACLSRYISWWNTMTMNQKAQSTRSEHVVYKYNSLRSQSVVKKWGELRQEYVDYTDEIKSVQDAEPELFTEPTQILIEKEEISEAVFSNSNSLMGLSPRRDGNTKGAAAPDGGALLFVPIFALSRGPANHKQLRKRDRIRAWRHRVWEEIVG